MFYGETFKSKISGPIDKKNMFYGESFKPEISGPIDKKWQTQSFG